MDWLDIPKIPVGWAAKQVVDWLKANARPLFDGISDAFGWLIDATLALIQTPHPLVVVALFVALTWVLQRSWKICLLVLLGFLFILNQGYWKATTESLVLLF